MNPNAKIAQTMMDTFRRLSPTASTFLRKHMSHPDTPDFVFEYIGDCETPDADQLLSWMELSATGGAKCMKAYPITRQEAMDKKLVQVGSGLSNHVFFISVIHENSHAIGLGLGFDTPPWIPK